MAQTLTTAPATSRMKTLQPVCPACGGLECLCRPRFFAGQLLTEEDLNRLDHYIVEKNKLHNRYLHGWGVVCGLEVFCHPCEGQVTVTSGYALSPCGDDIVLCADDVVNVCDLIQRCRERERLDCEPPRPAATAECQDVTEQWVLTVCFTEKASRGVTALRGSSEAACCSSCSCGGSASCGCGCQESGISRKQPAPPARSARSLSTDARSGRDLCEPTVTCESHYFSLYKASAADPKPGEALGAMIQRFEACHERFVRCRAAAADEHRASAGMVLSAEAELHRLLNRSPDPRLPRLAETCAVRLSRAESESDAGTILDRSAHADSADSRRIYSFVRVFGPVASLPRSGRQQLRAAGNDYDSQARLQNHAGVQLERAQVRDHLSQSAVLALLPAVRAQPAAGHRDRLLPAVSVAWQRRPLGGNAIGSDALPLSGERRRQSIQSRNFPECCWTRSGIATARSTRRRSFSARWSFRMTKIGR